MARLNSISVFVVLSLLSAIHLVNSLNDDSDPQEDVLDILMGVAPSESIKALSIDKSYKGEFKTISKVLTSKVDSDDFETNMVAASELLNDKLSEGPINKLFSRSTIDALDLFMSIKEVLDDEDCTQTSYKIMVRVDIASQGAAIIPDPTTRIGKLIRDASLKYANMCVSDMEKKFVMDREPMQEKDCAHILSFTDKLVDLIDNSKPVVDLGQLPWYKIQTAYEPRALPEGPNSLARFGVPEIVYQFLVDWAKEDPDYKYLKMVHDRATCGFRVDMVKIRQLVDRYFVEPCKRFIEAHENLRGPGRFFNHVLGDQTIATKSHELWIGLRALNLCHSLIHKDRVNVANGVGGIISDLKFFSTLKSTTTTVAPISVL